MPYKVIGHPSVNVLEKIGEIVDADGKHVAYEHASNLYEYDAVIPDEKVSPVVQKEVEDGGHASTLLVKVGEDKEDKPKPATRGRAKAKTDDNEEE